MNARAVSTTATPSPSSPATTTTTATATAAASPGRPSVARLAVCWATIAAVLPYLTLKLLWLSGVPVGLVDRSATESGTLAVLNTVTLGMDAIAAFVALALTYRRGRRLPALLLTPPMWVASGLLGAVILVVPIQLLWSAANGTSAFTGTSSSTGSGSGGGSEFLRPWVYEVVYSGFIVQGLGLLTAFALYSRARWPHLLRGTLTASARPTGRRRADFAPAALAAVTALPLLYWGFGGRAGLPAAQAAAQTHTGSMLDVARGLAAPVAAVGVAGILRGGRAWALPAPRSPPNSDSAARRSRRTSAQSCPSSARATGPRRSSQHTNPASSGPAADDADTLRRARDPTRPPPRQLNRAAAPPAVRRRSRSSRSPNTGSSPSRRKAGCAGRAAPSYRRRCRRRRSSRCAPARAALSARRTARPRRAGRTAAATRGTAAAPSEFELALGEIPQVSQAQRLFGDPDYLLRVVTRDLAAYRELYDERLATLPGVQRLSSTLVMKSVVESRPLPL